MAVGCTLLLNYYIHGVPKHLCDIDSDIRYKIRQKLVDRFGLPKFKSKNKNDNNN